MYRIAICDDDPIFSHQLNQNIIEIMNKHGLVKGIDYDSDQFSNTLGIQQILQQDTNYYQLLLLDIELPNENGMNIAKALRKQHITCSIIFITSYRDYIYDCFDAQPLWYMLKPINLEKFEEILLSDYQRNYANTRLIIKIKGKHIAIPFHDIYALESTQHRTKIWLSKGEYNWTGALSALKPQLPALNFCQSHNSYIINLSHVREILHTDVLMDDDRLFPISRRYHDQILDKYFAFLKI